MSAPIDDGGPAFPVEGFSPNLGSIIRSSGMTMRDWFAGQALAGMHARDSFDRGLASPEQRARVAYIDADAMLAERKRGGAS